MTKRVQQIGEIGVDAGLCWIGDPSYILHVGQLPKAVGKDCEELCEILEEVDVDMPYKQFNYNKGHPGLGVVVSTGYGDGIYPVYAEFNEEGLIARVCVEFISDEDADAD